MKNNPTTEAYASQIKEASQRALEAAGRNEYQLGIAGQIISLQFAGTALVETILPALRHLLIEPISAADLTVTLWDSASTGVELPEFPWHPHAKEAWKIDEDRYLAFFLSARNNLTWLNRMENRAFYWGSDIGATPGVESCDPILNLWQWWFEQLPAQLVHAAAVGGSRGAALLVGRGGSGKSTTVLQTLNSPLRYLADDYCLVTLQPRPTVHSLFASAKVLLADQARFPWLNQVHIGNNDEKALYILYPQLAGQLVRQMPLQALIVPKLTGERHTRLDPARPMDILRALAPSTLMQLHVGTDPAKALRLLTDLTLQLPCYHLLLGTDFEHIPAVLAELLDA